MTAGPIYPQGAQGGIPTTFSGNVVIPKASGSGIQIDPTAPGYGRADLMGQYLFNT